MKWLFLFYFLICFWDLQALAIAQKDIKIFSCSGLFGPKSKAQGYLFAFQHIQSESKLIVGDFALLSQQTPDLQKALRGIIRKSQIGHKGAVIEVAVMRATFLSGPPIYVQMNSKSSDSIKVEHILNAFRIYLLPEIQKRKEEPSFIDIYHTHPSKKGEGTTAMLSDSDGVAIIAFLEELFLKYHKFDYTSVSVSAIAMESLSYSEHGSVDALIHTLLVPSMMLDQPEYDRLRDHFFKSSLKQ